jgi:anti-sigma factor RsiW
MISGEPQLARDASYYPAPDALRARLRAAAPRTAPTRRWLGLEPRLGTWGTLGAAFATAGMLAWSGVLLAPGRGPEDRLAAEIAGAHVRSLLMPSHLNDVVSTDQHSVKPWFQGKLNYAPHVTDLANAGFELTGGRLDYIDGHTVAAVTYRHRLHVVNLFEWPTGAADARPALRARDGYSRVRWSYGGMEYWGISDTAGADLLQFAELLSGR